MNQIERVAKQISRLPEPLQQEVIDFVEFLQAKHHVGQETQKDDLLIDLKGGLETSSTFAGDEWKIQERLRDEWS
ncbi:DUF2281 domain-containing protein [Halomonas sp. ANAO-440]|uniref:DUF2281 domain-containing protein n=1 Tax=Halomonas sp. ANAO-440 TaxID=2861360 RepID=UPI001CAA547E|nr:DUF2281 domain-containing protein [Halomonas sp. ANAO-440]MBZ0331873.1 DUF2281 domain-containing protein [Halomonas sp. ANAO-440]